MTKAEAIRAMLSFQRVRSTHWDADRFICFDGEGFVDEAGRGYCIDIVQEDWEIYEKKVEITRERLKKAILAIKPATTLEEFFETLCKELKL
jgi:hypothetical protein